VEVGDSGRQDADSAVTLEHSAQRVRDLACREHSGRDLVCKRLKEVEVAVND
jgi:hypothetical protein